MTATVQRLQRAFAQPRQFVLPVRSRCFSSLPSRYASRSPSPPPSCNSVDTGLHGSNALSTSLSPLLRPRFGSHASRAARVLSTSSGLRRETNAAQPKGAEKDLDVTDPKEHELHAFGRSEKATKAAQVNLSAKLHKDGKSKGGWAEIVRLLSIARPESKWLGAAFGCLLVSSSITMSIPFAIGKIMDAATNAESESFLGLTPFQFYGTLAGIMVCGAAANYGRIIMLRLVGERIVARLRSQLFRRTYIQNAEFFDANRVGDLISRLSSDTIIVGKSITQNLSDGLRAIVSGTAGLGLMAYVSFKLTSVMAFMFPPVAIMAFFYGRNIRTISRKIQRALGNLTKIAEERLSNVRTSQAFAGEILEVGRYNEGIRKVYALGRKEAFVSGTFFSTTGLMGNLTILSILYIGGTLVKSGAITVGELSSFLMYTAYAGSSMFGLSSFYSELMKGVGAASRLFELQDRKPSISTTTGVPAKSARGIIKFTDVSFSYPTRPAVTIFDKINFEIKPGTNVAIVGPSGGGKSTITSLLLRFYNPTHGSISINDVDISTFNLKSLRRRIGVVSQEPVLFSGTIAENIAYGKPNATRLEIVEAARRANCTFIADFPDGLETNVGARGAMLSGGQKQRIAIARALLKKPDILILDEATSALDAESEAAVNEALGKLMKSESTTISIAHRLSTIRRSDVIIVLGNDGTVAESGTFEELSARDGPFRRLMEWQLNGGESAPIQLYHGHPVESEEEHLEAEQEAGHENEAEEEDEERAMRAKAPENK